jgi:hypothetical protein
MRRSTSFLRKSNLPKQVHQSVRIEQCSVGVTHPAPVLRSTLMTPLQVVAAKCLSIQRKQLLQLAREGKLPADPIGDGQRRLWRFRLSDLAKAMEERMIHGKSTGTIPKTRPIR